MDKYGKVPSVLERDLKRIMKYEIERASCGCCYNGCYCRQHVPMDLKPVACDIHEGCMHCKHPLVPGLNTDFCSFECELLWRNANLATFAPCRCGAEMHPWVEWELSQGVVNEGWIHMPPMCGEYKVSYGFIIDDDPCDYEGAPA